MSNTVATDTIRTMDRHERAQLALPTRRGRRILRIRRPRRSQRWSTVPRAPR